MVTTRCSVPRYGLHPACPRDRKPALQATKTSALLDLGDQTWEIPTICFLVMMYAAIKIVTILHSQKSKKQHNPFECLYHDCYPKNGI